MQYLKQLTKPLKAGFNNATIYSITQPFCATFRAQYNGNTKRYTINVYMHGGALVGSYTSTNFSYIKGKVNKRIAVVALKQL